MRTKTDTRQTHRRLVPLCCFGLLLYAFLLVSCKQTSPTTQPRASIEFLEDNRYDFGEVANQDSIIHYYRYKNVGDVPFVINSAETQCGCTKFCYSKQPLPPGGVDSIRVAYGIKNQMDGFVIKGVSIYSNADSVYTVFIQGILK